MNPPTAVRTTLAPHVNGTPGWAELPSGLTYVVQHTPAGAGNGVAVLMLPPFGWEEVCSSRDRREWATALARAGFTVARMDLPGTGESDGWPRDHGLFESWRASVREVIAWLRTSTGAPRLAVIGIGLGAILAMDAICCGGGVDDLIIWGAPGSGRVHMRQLEMLSRVVAANLPEDSEGHQEADGTLGLAGFAMSKETAEAVRSWRLGEPPSGDGRAVLMLERDGVKADTAVAEAFAAQGWNVSTSPANDYHLLMAEPMLPGIPHDTIGKTTDWLTSRAAVMPRSAGVTYSDGAAETRPVAGAAQAVTMRFEESLVREALTAIEIDGKRWIGSITEPADGVVAPIAAVLFNAGAIRRMGPNRMWVEVARRWAAAGVRVVRFDCEGVGDSDGAPRSNLTVDDLYSVEMHAKTLAMVDSLQGSVGDRFIAVGLCSGAYWGLQATLTRESIVGGATVNLVTFQWAEGLAEQQNLAKLLRMLRGGIFTRVRRIGISRRDLRRLLSALEGARRKLLRQSVEKAQADVVARSLERLLDGNKELFMFFSKDEGLRHELERSGEFADPARWPNVHLETLGTRDHDVRALWAQRDVHDRLDRALEAFRTSAGDPESAVVGNGPPVGRAAH